MTDTSPSSAARRVALVADAGNYVGPQIAQQLARRGHDLVLGNADETQVAELEALGAAVVAVPGTRDTTQPEAIQALVDGGLERFGRIDAAQYFSGRIVTGPFLQSSLDDLRKVEAGCLEAPYHFLRIVTPVMVAQGGGQILVLTSASGARATKDAPLYSAVRAGATHLVKNVAAEVARHGVQVNALGTNYMDFPEFRRATGADDPAIRSRIEAAVPMKRLGTMEECAAFCMAFLDGTSGFTTGQFVSYAGGWS